MESFYLLCLVESNTKKLDKNKGDNTNLYQLLNNCC